MILVPQYRTWEGITIGGEQVYILEAYSCKRFDVDSWACTLNGACSMHDTCRKGLIHTDGDGFYVERDGRKEQV